MPMVILATDLNLPDVQQAVEALRAGKNCPLPEDPQQLKLF